MSATSRQSLLNVLERLEIAQGFETTVKPSPGNAEEVIAWYATKPTHKHYVGAHVMLRILYHHTKKCWWVSLFEVSMIYLGSLDPDGEERAWRSLKQSTLRHERFFAHIGKIAGRQLNSDSWTVRCPQDLVAFFEAYDKAAKFYGDLPIFLG